jgi:adenylate kinase
MELAVLLGPPGSGKGTVAAEVIRQTGFNHISTGAYIRREMEIPDSKIGIASKPYMDRSEFVPDDIALDLVDTILAEYPLRSELLFDGFPRTAIQGATFDRMVNLREYTFLGAFSLEAPDDVLAERLAGRRCCTSCDAVFNLVWNRPERADVCDACKGQLEQRMDDLERNVKKRIRLHMEQTLDLIQYYEERDVLHRIDACRTPEQSAQQIIECIDTQKND